MKKLTLGFVAIFVLFASFSAFAQESAKTTPPAQNQAQKPAAPDLPDLTKAPFYLVQSDVAAVPRLHGDWGELPGKLYTNVKLNADGSAQIDKDTKDISYVMVFLNPDGSIRYAEWLRTELTKFDQDGKPTEGLRTFRGYNFVNGKFVYDTAEEPVTLRQKI